MSASIICSSMSGVDDPLPSGLAEPVCGITSLPLLGSDDCEEEVRGGTTSNALSNEPFASPVTCRLERELAREELGIETDAEGGAVWSGETQIVASSICGVVESIMKNQNNICTWCEEKGGE